MKKVFDAVLQSSSQSNGDSARSPCCSECASRSFAFGMGADHGERRFLEGVSGQNHRIHNVERLPFFSGLPEPVHGGGRPQNFRDFIKDVIDHTFNPIRPFDASRPDFYPTFHPECFQITTIMTCLWAQNLIQFSMSQDTLMGIERLLTSVSGARGSLCDDSLGYLDLAAPFATDWMAGAVEDRATDPRAWHTREVGLDPSSADFWWFDDRYRMRLEAEMSGLRDSTNALARFNVSRGSGLPEKVRQIELQRYSRMSCMVFKTMYAMLWALSFEKLRVGYFIDETHRGFGDDLTRLGFVGRRMRDPQCREMILNWYSLSNWPLLGSIPPRAWPGTAYSSIVDTFYRIMNSAADLERWYSAVVGSVGTRDQNELVRVPGVAYCPSQMRDFLP